MVINRRQRHSWCANLVANFQSSSIRESHKGISAPHRATLLAFHGWHFAPFLSFTDLRIVAMLAELGHLDLVRTCFLSLLSRSFVWTRCILACSLNLLSWVRVGFLQWDSLISKTSTFSEIANLRNSVLNLKRPWFASSEILRRSKENLEYFKHIRYSESEIHL